MMPRIVLQDKPSVVPILVVWPFTGILFAAIFGCFAFTMNSIQLLSGFFIFLGVLGLGIATVRTMAELAQREFTTYTLTESHIIIERGIFNRDEEKIPLTRIANTKIEWAFAGRIFNYGDLMIISGTEIKLWSIPHPKRWSTEIEARR